MHAPDVRSREVRGTGVGRPGGSVGRSERHKAAICMHAVAEGTEALVAPGVGANTGWSLKDIDIVVGMRGAEALLEACAFFFQRRVRSKQHMQEKKMVTSASVARHTDAIFGTSVHAAHICMCGTCMHFKRVR